MKLWKKIVILLVIIADFITLTFFTPITFKTLIPSSFNSKQKISDKELGIEIKDGTITKDEVTIIYKNATDQTMMYGAKYSLEYKIFGTWFVIKPIDINPSYLFMLYAIKPGTSKERTIKWEEMYGHLRKGKYRIVHDILVGEDKTEDRYTYAEFEIQ